MANLDGDPRWRKLWSRQTICKTCNSTHEGLFDIGCRGPDYWRDEYGPALQNGAIHNFAGDNILTEDFCVIKRTDFFVRGLVLLSILGSTEVEFGYGVWVSLSKANFETYVNTFDSGKQGDLGGWFGWFSNRLPGYPDTLNLKSNVHPQAGKMRPLIELKDLDHPLAQEQANGVTFDRLLDIYALNGHDIRSALVD